MCLQLSIAYMLLKLHKRDFFYRNYSKWGIRLKKIKSDASWHYYHEEFLGLPKDVTIWVSELGFGYKFNEK